MMVSNCLIGQPSTESKRRIEKIRKDKTVGKHIYERINEISFQRKFMFSPIYKDEEYTTKKF